MTAPEMPFVAVAITATDVGRHTVYGATCLRCGWEAERDLDQAVVVRRAKRHDCTA